MAAKPPSNCRVEPQRPGRREGLCLLAAALLTALLFASGTLDIAAARWFYRADAADHWPLARQFPWPLLYRAATWITASLVIMGLAALAASTAAARRHWRRPAVLVLLAVVIGPGLLGNALFKDHWHHPRPRDIVEFGGSQHYVPAPLIGAEGGASFPCGHCTVGFLYAAGWWIWRRRRPHLAAASLAGGLLVGLLLGVGRMAAGAHFISDNLWSALLAFGVLHLLYYHVLRFPAESAGTRAAVPLSRRGRLTTLAALVGGAAVLLALFATPHGAALTARLPLASLPGPPRVLEVDADAADIDIVLLDVPAAELAIDGELHGFGFPTSRLGAHLELVPGPPPRVRYRIEARGWLTDVDGSAKLRVPATAFARVIVAVRQGNIRVSDTTRARRVGAGTLQLELHTGRGRIQSL
jgi:lipid A 4'-phosphatase